MPFLPFLHRHSTNQPLTEGRMHQILKTAHCTVRYRFALVLAVDRTEQEYFICLKTQLATMTVQQCTAALTQALSFRLRSAKPSLERRGTRSYIHTPPLQSSCVGRCLFHSGAP
jgi:hypothetical protein